MYNLYARVSPNCPAHLQRPLIAVAPCYSYCRAGYIFLVHTMTSPAWTARATELVSNVRELAQAHEIMVQSRIQEQQRCAFGYSALLLPDLTCQPRIQAPPSPSNTIASTIQPQSYL